MPRFDESPIRDSTTYLTSWHCRQEFVSTSPRKVVHVDTGIIGTETSISRGSRASSTWSLVQMEAELGNRGEGGGFELQETMPIQVMAPSLTPSLPLEARQCSTTQPHRATGAKAAALSSRKPCPYRYWLPHSLAPP